MRKEWQMKVACISVLAGLLIVSCGDEHHNTIVGADVEASLVCSPNTLHIADVQPTGTLYLGTAPPGEIQWKVTSKPAWLSVQPEGGTVGDTFLDVAVVCDPQGLQPGVYQDRIEIISTGGEAVVEVTFTVSVRPQVELSMEALDFPTDTAWQSITLSNPGNGPLYWSMNASESWLTAIPQSGMLLPGTSVEVLIQVNRAGLDIGEFAAELVLASNASGDDVVVPVTMKVGELPLLALSTSSLDFAYFVDADAFTIRNDGNAVFHWTAASDAGFVSLDTTAGTLQGGESVGVGVTVERTGLVTGDHSATITVDTDADQTAQVGVVVHHFVSQLWKLDHRVTDAEYDRNADVIVTVSQSPPQLHVLDPESENIESVDLALPPACLSIRPHGAYAAVGHNGYVSYVNLASLSVDRTYAVTCDAFDIVLAGNGWAYVFPREDQWERIRCLNLATGQEVLHTGNSIYDSTRAKLHPSGNYIYGADNGLSPSDFEKYNITGGTAVYMYDSPYHGTYPFGGNLWIADDGLRLFARSGYVFRSSKVQEEDMVYNGSLAGIGVVESLDHSSAAGRIYAIDGGDYWNPPASEVRVYENEYMAFQGVVPLPQFLVPDGQGGGDLYDATGQFVFVNADGTRFHALVKSDEDAGMLMDWAVASFDVADNP